MSSTSNDDLLSFVESVVGEEPLRVEESLGDGFVRLRVSEAERRQAKHDIRSIEDATIEILRNARDAGATTIYLATSREGDQRVLTCIDDGCGMPATMAERIFEARVTSKLDSMAMDRWGVHGRGMALFSIRHNALESRVCASAPDLGTSLIARFDCASVNERADQSTWPKIAKNENGRFVTVKGPHNILRTAIDFSLDSRKRLDVYLGSAADILATLLARGRATQNSEPADGVPIWCRPSLAANAQELVQVAGELGLSVSERTAYRVLAGDVEPLLPLDVCALEVGYARHGSTKEVDLGKDCRGLKVGASDLEDFSHEMERSFDLLAQRYYLQLRGEPKVRVGHDAITVTFEIDKMA